MSVLKPLAAMAALTTVILSGAANAFCGFYVARADTALYNDSSQVVLVRDDARTVMTMNNRFLKGKISQIRLYGLLDNIIFLRTPRTQRSTTMRPRSCSCVTTNARL